MHRPIIFLSLALLHLPICAQSFSNWGYWLSDIQPSVVSSSEYEMVVIDYSCDGIDAFTREEVKAMKKMPDGTDRTVISYFSIGEAEEYRFYWKKEWLVNRPYFLEKENPDWPGNYKVRYWDQSWQHILYGHEGAYLDKIIDAGFDGIYLDIIDAFEHFEDSRPSAEREMVDLVKNLASYARLKNPDFQVITQNGERLLGHPDLLAAIDGAAKEDLYFGLEGDNIPAPQEETDYSLQFYRLAVQQGKYILLASYVDIASERPIVKQKGESEGFLVYFGDRDLEHLSKNSGLSIDEFYKKPSSNSIAQRTPGDFFLFTLVKGQVKSSYSLQYYLETSIYSEEDEQGTILFAENVRFSQEQALLSIEYGLTDLWEIGFRIPGTRSTLDLDEFIGGDRQIRERQTGLGNIILTSNLRIPYGNDDNFYSLISMETGLPTDTRTGNLNSATFTSLRFNAEKFWSKIGIGGSLGWYRFADDHSLVSSLGIRGILSERLFSGLSFTNIGGRQLVESSFEYLVSSRSSLELYIAKDAMSDLDIFNAAITFRTFH